MINFSMWEGSVIDHLYCEPFECKKGGRKGTEICSHFSSMFPRFVIICDKQMQTSTLWSQIKAISQQYYVFIITLILIWINVIYIYNYKFNHASIILLLEKFNLFNFAYTYLKKNCI